MVPFGLRSQIKNIPVVKQLQALVLKKYFSDKEFVATITGGPAKGLRFPVQMPQDKLMWIGTWELEFAKKLQQMIKPGWVCYDIGGYKGYYAGIMALHGAGDVIIFEPMPVNIQKIKNLISLNPTLPLTLIEKAVSNHTGKKVFNMMPEDTMGKLEESSFQREAPALRQLEVETDKLDNIVLNYPEPDLIKIDVEGAEELVLKGGLELLKRKKPVLMIEVHSHGIGKRCYELLKNTYQKIYVFETGQAPGNDEAEICHYIAMLEKNIDHISALPAIQPGRSAQTKAVRTTSAFVWVGACYTYGR